MKIQLSDHFTCKRLLKFVLPSVVMMIFTSIYGVIDGLFVSNFVGKTPFAAVNFIMPVLMMMSALGFMIGSGGSAITAKTLGEGDNAKANGVFSLMVYTAIILGIILTMVGQLALRPLSAALGAEGEMLEYCVSYGRIILLALTPFMLQNVFQSYFVTAAKPHIGLAVTVAAGGANIVGDYLFIAVFKWGIEGAALATALSQCIGGLVPLFYFARKNSSLLKLGKPLIDMKLLLDACINGSSELMTNIAMSLANMLYNYQLMKTAGEDGVAAYGVIMYAAYIFAAIYIGFSIGSAPVTSYHYGAQNHGELKNLFATSLKILAAAAVIITLISILMAGRLTKIFVGYDQELYEMTSHGFRLYSLSFLLCGFNIYASSLFTALGNGAVSAAISFLRTLLFQVISVLILPLILGINGIWLAVTAAEVMALAVTVTFLIKYRNRYHYA